MIEADSTRADSEAILQADLRALDAIAMHICVLDRKGTVIHVNRMWLTGALNCGCTLSPLPVGSDYLAQCRMTTGESAPAAAELAAGLAAMLRREATECRVEYPCVSSGVQHWFQARATWFDIDSAAIVVIHEDITARRKAEEALRYEHSFSSSLVETAHAIVLVLDPSGRIVYFNRFMTEISGYSLIEVQGRDWIDAFVVEDERARIRQLLGHAVDGERTRGNVNLIRCKNGATRAIEWYDSALKDADGVLTGLLAIGQDVTARRSAEGALQQSEERFRSIVETAREGIVIVDAAGVVEYLNPWAAEILGRSQDDILGWPWAGFVPEADRERHAELLHGKPHGPREAVELRLVRGDRNIVWVQATIGRGQFAAGRREGTMVMFDDVTAMKKKELEVTRSNEALRRLSARLHSVREEERTRIAREIHDELGAALTRIKLDASWLARAEAAAAGAERSRLAKLIDDIDGAIGTVRRIASELRPSMLDHLGLAPAVEWEARQFEERSGTRCSVDARMGDVDLDPARATAVFRIFQEALTNVARHAAATEVNVALDCDGREVTLRVADNGKGIERKRLASVQSLGLIGMRERARSLGGDVEIRSGRPKGTVVTLTMPLGAVDGKV